MLRSTQGCVFQIVWGVINRPHPGSIFKSLAFWAHAGQVAENTVSFLLLRIRAPPPPLTCGCAGASL